MMTETLAAPQTEKQDWLPCNFVLTSASTGSEMIRVKSFRGAQLEFRLMRSLMPHGAKPVSSMDTLREIYGYRPSRAVVPDLREWTFGQAEDARSNEDLAHVLLCGVGKLPPFCPQYRQSSACARMFVAAERRIETRLRKI